MSAVLSVAGLSKKFASSLRRSLWYGMTDVARELVPFGAPDSALRSGEFWALDDVSFEVARGASLAIVGGNGAGKSTLLKIVYGLLKPDAGEVRLRGRAEALIELGTGFNPVLTGRENVLVGASLHGLDRRASAVLVERVADFAELGEFLDAPLQSYSSGMKARLGYALSANLEPDLLIIDEVLAVGDLAFQRKCAQHMHAYLERGGSLLLVSHNTWHVQSVCEHGLLLDRGRVVFRGSAVETITAMLERNQAEAARAPRASASGPVVIDDVTITPLEGDAIRTGAAVRIALRYRSDARAEVLWGWSIWTADQWVCIAGEHEMTPRTIEAGEGVLACVIPRLPLVGGRYALRAGIVDPATLQPLAVLGWEDAPVILDVAADATPQGNAARTLGQLIAIDVDWR